MSFILSVTCHPFMLDVIIMNVIMLTIVMLSVMAPQFIQLAESDSPMEDDSMPCNLGYKETALEKQP